MTYTDQTIGEFLDGVASGEVTPSGGAVAAVGGAAGAALCEMVCVHMIEYGDGDATELVALCEELGEYRAQLLDLADEDAAAVEALGDAFEKPAGEDRAEAIQAAARRASEVPLRTAEASQAVVDRAVVVTERGNPNAVADAATGALLAHAAVEASVLAARANLGLIDNEAFAAERDERAADLLGAAEAALADVRANVTDR